MAGQPLPYEDTPLVGRVEELAVVESSLERGGLVIAGPAGVGKSRLAGEAARRRQAPRLRVVATAAARSFPFGAFARLLADLSIDARGVVAAAVEALRRASPGLPLTLVVDDAHLLDEASAALVFAAWDAEAARLIATLREGERAPDAITALWKEGLVPRVDLGPMTRRELRALVDSHLGGPAEPDVHARVYSLTEGNPLYARELLIDARRSGALQETGGRWRWTASRPGFTRLRDLIEARTRDLNPDARRTLELLAVGGALRLEELAGLSEEDSIEDLERAGLVVVQGDPPSLVVDLAHPLFREVTLAGMSAATSRRHRMRLAAVVDPESADPYDLLRLATLKLESGERDPELFLRAGAIALAVEAGVPGPGWGGGDPPLAVRFADASGGSLEAGLLGARGRMALGRLTDVAEHLAPLEGVAATAPFEQAAEYLRTRVNALHGGEATEEALALLERARSWRSEPEWIALWSTLTAWILHDQGRPASAAAAIGPATRLEGLPPRVHLDALVILALVESRLGLTGRCEALEPEIKRLAAGLEQAGSETGWASHAVDALSRSESARDLAGVAHRLTEGRRRAEADGDTTLAAALAMGLGRMELTCGHVQEAILLLEEAAEGLVTGDPANALGWALCHLTRAHALSGDAPAALGTLARAEAVAQSRPGKVRLGLEVERARAWSDAVLGKLSAARGRLLGAAANAGEALAFEAEVTYDALRLGADRRTCAERLASLSARADSDLIDACAEHAAALAARDPEAQQCAAERFAALGLDLLAAEAAAEAARAFALRGRQDSARRARAMSARHAALCPGALTPSLAQEPAGVRLTSREREIALLAAAGLSNARIACELSLSVRTVETYVLRACHKLGITARTDLSRMLAPGGAQDLRR